MAAQYARVSGTRICLRAEIGSGLRVTTGGVVGSYRGGMFRVSTHEGMQAMRKHASTPSETKWSPSGERLADSVREAARTSGEDPRPTVNRSGVIIGVGAVCAVLGAVSLATQQIWSILAGEVIEIDTPILGTALYAAQIALFVVAVVGLYLHQRKAFNTFGEIATLIALLGTLLWSGSAASQALDVVAGGGKPAPDNIPTPLLVWIFIAFGLYAVGLILFGIATWRAGVLPPVSAALVVFGIPLGLVLDGFVPGILMVYGAGIAWLGVATLVQLRSGQPAGAEPARPDR
jgi:hypothetical protein